MAAAERQLVIDRLQLLMRKPSAAPTLYPSEVIAISLNAVRWVPGRMHGPDDKVVQMILHGLKEAGYKIEPL